MSRKKSNPVAVTAEPLIVIPGACYTSAETAKFLRLKPETLEVWRSAGRYPALRSRKVGGKVIYKGEDILAFLDAPHEKARIYTPKAPRPRLVPAARRRRAAK